MNGRDPLETLRSLLKLDYDAMQAHDRAVVLIRTPEIRHALMRFKEDHAGHVKNLTDLIEKQGGLSPEPAIDVQGVFLAAIAVIQGKHGEWAVVKACEKGEKYTTFGYGEAFKCDFPFVIMRIVQKNYMDERHHLSHVQHLLRTRTDLSIGRVVGFGALGAAAGLVAWSRLARAR